MIEISFSIFGISVVSKPLPKGDPLVREGVECAWRAVRFGECGETHWTQRAKRVPLWAPLLFSLHATTQRQLVITKPCRTRVPQGRWLELELSAG
jgi:hypothetical protein